VLQFDCAFTLAFRQWAEVTGTGARLRLEDFVISQSHSSAPFSVVASPNLDAKHESVVGTETVHSSACNQEAAMWRTFSSGSSFEPRWACQSLAVQACLDAAMRSMEAAGAETAVVEPALLRELRG
jgi:hypothetical protein